MPNLPGTIGLAPALFADLNEQVSEQLIKNGFRNVVLMGDHGGGRKELREVAEKLDHKYSCRHPGHFGDALPRWPEGMSAQFTGDARRSTAALGKRLFDMKVDYAVRIR